MSVLLVDTDVASFFFKGHSTATEYAEVMAGRSLFMCFMSVAELDRWALQSNWGVARRSRLDEFIRKFTVIPYSRAICTRWAEVTVEAQQRGRRIECADAWIAATAIHYQLPLATHNEKDYRGVTGLDVISYGAR